MKISYQGRKQKAQGAHLHISAVGFCFCEYFKIVPDSMIIEDFSSIWIFLFDSDTIWSRFGLAFGINVAHCALRTEA